MGGNGGGDESGGGGSLGNGGDGAGRDKAPELTSLIPAEIWLEVQTVPGRGRLYGVTPQVPSQSLVSFESTGDRLKEQPAPSGIITDDHCTKPKPGPHLVPCSTS